MKLKIKINFKNQSLKEVQINKINISSRFHYKNTKAINGAMIREFFNLRMTMVSKMKKDLKMMILIIRARCNMDKK